ncbi:hypothetical protein BHE90_009328 [Fusarium euwallaceae]|uniref:Uncharacterized protein n=3 Tax=Fusarium solani species complex TaxID=232080 RepID=A0A3M2S5S2_9HYPO|nr:hypothetical protein CDV36_007726 [Fusarium kuroshium]RSL79249.1 hypothetical protein CEP51_007510 [Fusarium floridanum]RTE76212.1 hypothetical protein BHE90_009328 [Fusarium euwallaceae]
MNPQQPPGFAAEFIVEDPGRPVPQRPVRRRGLETQRKWIRNWMKRLPQGDEDWDNNSPSTPDDIQRLRDRLTLSHIQSRHEMDWATLLDTYAAAAKDFEGRELQLHSMVMVAACHVAYNNGLPRDDMLQAMAKCISGGSDTLRSKRFALPKCILIGDELASVLGVRAYELPLRVNSYFTFGQHFTSECFPLLREESAVAHRPTTPLPSEVLRIPSLVFDLCNGKVSRKQVEKSLTTGNSRSTAGGSGSGTASDANTDHDMIHIMK